jgi:hypothetical protein
MATTREMRLEIKTVMGKAEADVQYKLYADGDVVINGIYNNGIDFYPLISDNQEKAIIQTIKKHHKVY